MACLPARIASACAAPADEESTSVLKEKTIALCPLVDYTKKCKFEMYFGEGQGMSSYVVSPRKRSLGRRILQHWPLYALLLPAVVVTLLFNYYPLYGVQLAFKNMKLGQSISAAPWVGLQNFRRFFTAGYFERTLVNTLMLSLLTQLTFPLPIILALLLHNCVNKHIKKGAQMLTYIPNLVSVAVTMSIVLLFCGNSTGFINILLGQLGLEGVPFMSREEYVRPMYVISEVWNSVGYNAVIYLAALTSISQELTDAAMIDGCSKLKRIWYIDLPTILPTIVVLLIMSMGKFLNSSTEKMLMLQTDLNLATSETIGTYTYKIGLVKRQYGYSAAVDLFTNVINFSTLLIVNFVSKHVSNSSLF